jgi:S-formylglutathione hydrolase FrmB
VQDCPSFQHDTMPGMPVAHLNYFSPAIEKHTAMIVILPDGPGPHPVVYLLHGQSDDYTAWQRWTTIEMHARRLNIALALVDGDRSFYCDTPKTRRQYEQHILHAVTFVDQTFDTIRTPSGRGLGGLSMGGYGALKIALAHPDIFGSCAAHSGALDMATWITSGDTPDFLDIWPKGRLPAHDDVRKLLAKPGRKPAIYLDCGTEDFLLDQNRTIKADLVRRKIPHIYLEYPGTHNWDYWQAHIGEALDFHKGNFAKATKSTRRAKRTDQ